MIRILNNLRILQSEKSIGLSLYKSGEDVYDIDLVELTKTKSAISISNKKNLNGNLSKVIELIPKGVPVFISLDGKGILHKKSNKSNKPDNEIINNLFPNIKLADFHYQKHKLANDDNYLSIVRQSVIDTILESFDKKGVFVLGFSIGPVALNHIVPLLDEIETIVIKNYSLSISNGKINSIDKISADNSFNEQTFRIETEEIEASYLLPFSLAFSYFINVEEEGGKLSETINKSKEEFIYQNLLKLGGKFVLGLLLAILLINFIFFSHYNDKNNHLSMQYALQKDNIAKLDSLSKKIESKEKIITEKKLFLRSRFSYYCDRVAILVPNEVQLDELQIQPLLSTIDENELIEFDLSKMIIKGTSKSSIVVGEWISELKEEKWTKKVIMEDYNYDNKKKKANFSIKIDLSNEQADQ